MAITFKLRTDAELTELQAWQHLADFWNELRLGAADLHDYDLNKVEIEGEAERLCANGCGICRAIEEMNLSCTTKASMLKKVRDDMEVIREVFDNPRVQYLAPTGTWQGCAMRYAYCLKHIRRLP